MRLRPLLLFIAIDAATAATFGFAWGLHWQTCAPPSPACRTSLCPAICVNAWSQLPSNLVFGALLGLIPVTVAALGLLHLEHARRRRNPQADALWVAAVVIATAAGSILFYL
ncbi:MAG TPA: hypothetical protein HA326_05700 [Thermoplasmata archaeon]|nr:hypothetical protein [Thermoplasmata archaeon]